MRAVKVFMARPKKGERDPEMAEEQIANALENTLNKWVQATGYVFNLTIHNMSAVRMWNSVTLFVDYTVVPNKNSQDRLQEVWNAGREETEENSEEREKARKEDSVGTDITEGEGTQEAEGKGDAGGES